MKVPQCDWAPQLVVDWLCVELEDRGIPGPIYAHTLLSLLHTQYCPHPPIHSEISIPAASLKRRNCHRVRELNPKHLDLEDFTLDDLPHPDADLPDLTPIAALKCCGSRRARKRFRVRQKQRTYTTEELQKVAALQCLMSASDEDLENYELENLIEELCEKLKDWRESKENTSTSDCTPSEESSNDADTIENPQHQVQKYYAAFPPLSESISEGQPKVPTELSLEGINLMKSARQKAKPKGKVPNNSKYTRKKKKKHDIGVDELSTSKVEIGKTRKVMNPEDLWDAEPPLSCGPPKIGSGFSNAFLEDEIPEGYIGDTSSRESSEDRDNEVLKKNGPKTDHSSSQAKKPGFWEEWECAGIVTEADGGLPTSKKGRLFERCSTSGGTSGCSSDTENTKTDEEESIKLLDTKIADIVAGFNKSKGIWPSQTNEDQESELSPFQVGEIFMSRPSSATEIVTPSNENSFITEDHLPLPQFSDVWTSANMTVVKDLINQDPLFSSAFHHNPPLPEEAKDRFQAWSDYNANETIGDNTADKVTITIPVEEEVKLCESFSHLGIDNLWKEDLSKDVDSLSNSLTLPYNTSTSYNIFSDGKDLFQQELNPKISSESLLKPIPSGPSGPHPVLKHTESSGFTTVVPRKSAELFADISIDLTKSNSTSTSSIPAALIPDADHIVPTEEENLLTSPRTHFKPIRQESNSDSSSENQTVVSGFQHPELSFQRTGSGALFLESDLLEGSPKKYMIYRERLSKEGSFDNVEPPPKKMVSVPLVPKFKVVNNEKFSQTDGQEVNKDKFKNVVNDSVSFAGLSNLWNNDTDDQKTRNIWKTSAEIWNTNPDLANNSHSWLKDISHLDPWSTRDQYESTEKEFQTIEVPTQTKWFTNGTFSEGKSSLNDVKSLWKNVKIEAAPNSLGWCELSKDKQLESGSWFNAENNDQLEHQSMPVEPVTDAFLQFNQDSDIWKSNNTNDRNSIFWSIPGVSSDKRSLNNMSKTYHFDSSSQNTHPPNNDPGDAILKLISNNNYTPEVQKNTFLSQQGIEKNNEEVTVKTGIWEMSDKNPELLKSCRGWDIPIGKFPKEDTRPPLGSHSVWGSTDPEPKSIPHSLWNTQNPDLPSSMEPKLGSLKSVPHEIWKVDQLKSQIDRNAKAAPKQNHNLWNFIENSNTPRWDISSMEGKLKGCADATVSQQEDESGDVIPHFWFQHHMDEHSTAPPVNQEVVPMEDLDNLEPGWEFNEGFEWDQQHDDNESEDGDFEVLLYEQDDGSTIQVPVEYLDDSFYDEIFGHQDKPIGGSLPDMPFGNAMQGQLPRKVRAARWLPPSRRPCTFFMEGNCKRQDCKFSHNLASITCRFWEEGSCLKGDDCPFLHGYPLKRQRNKSEGSVSVCEAEDNLESFIHPSCFEIDSETDFPSLSSSVESKRTTPDEFMMQASAKTTTKSKKKKFITITRNIIGEKSVEKRCRVVRRKATRRQRKPQPDDDLASKVKATLDKKSTPKTVKKLARQLLPGYEDGTVSDY